MPKLYHYFGLTVFFYSNEHLPIHVHGRAERRESKAELIVREGVVTEIRLSLVEGRAPLKPGELKDFRELVQARATDIVSKWVAYFVENRKIQAENITRRLS
jgi:hypothetical protein